MRVTVHDRNRDGRGRTRVGGRTVLVSQAHPGEEVAVRVDRTTRGTVQGRVARILRKDPRRIAHECPHEFRCTGCPLLAAPLEDEEAFKEARLRDVLLRLGDVPGPERVRTPAGPFGYRHLAKEVFGRSRGRVVLGSYVAGTHRVVDSGGCPVLAPPLRALMQRVAAAADASEAPLHGPGSTGLRYAVARLSRATGRALLVLVTSESPPREAVELCRRLAARGGRLAGAHVLVNTSPGNALLAGELHAVAGEQVLREEAAGFRHEIGPRSFFQVNPASADVLAGLAVEAAGRGAVCVEGYAGVGALTLPLSRGFDRVVAVESAQEAAAALVRTARRHGRDGVAVVTGDVVEELPELLAREEPAAVVMDPPRAGLGFSVAGVLAGARCARIVLLSCDPETLARDLPPLLGAGWRVRRVVPVNQFPRTAHLETMTLLERPGEGGGR